MPLVMFVESHESFDDVGGSRREPWLLTVLDWLLPWPAVVVWLLAASRFTDGWAGAGLAYAAVLIFAWRALSALPDDGLNQSHQ